MGSSDGALRLHATLEPRGPAAAIILTDDQVASFGAGKTFAALAPSHRKEFARWIDEAKKDETRTSRVEQALAMLREGRTRR